MFLDRVFRLSILVLCFLRYVFCGKADIFQKSQKNFLIIPAGKLGDIICTTPIFRAIRKKYPDGKIFVYGNLLSRQILADAGLFDEFIEREGFLSDLRKIRKINISFACVTGSGFLDLALIYLAGVFLISAPVINEKKYIQETRPYKVLAKFVVQKKFTPGKYMPRQYLALLGPVDIHSSNTKKHLGFSSSAEEKVKVFYEENGVDLSRDFLVGITPSAGNKIKEWSTERFAKLADHISRKHGAKIVVFGGKNETKRSEKMIRQIGKETFFVDSTGMFNIDELKAAISMLDVFVSSDTGPIYIAEAFGVATVDIVGPVDENDQPPVGEFHKIVKWEARKKPAMNALNARNYDYDEAKKQVEKITVQMVAEKVDELISIKK